MGLAAGLNNEVGEDARGCAVGRDEEDAGELAGVGRVRMAIAKYLTRR